MRNPNRIVISVALSIILASTIACGPSAQQKAFQLTLRGLDASMAGVEAWDAAEQTRIVKEAPSFEEGQKQLAAHRAKKAEIIKAATIAYSALAAVVLAYESHDASFQSKLVEATKIFYDFFDLVKHTTGKDAP